MLHSTPTIRIEESELDERLISLSMPHPPPPYDETQITPINQGWNILPDGAPAIDRSLKGRLPGFNWRIVGPPLAAQQAFNAALVDHLNRNIAAHRETERAMASTIALIREQSDAQLHFQSMLLGLLQSLTLYVDTKDRNVGGQVQVLNAALGALTDDWMKHWESQRVREDRFEAQHPALLRAYEELSQKVSLAQQTTLLLKREVERLLLDAQVTPGDAPDTAISHSAPRTPHTALRTDAIEALDSFKYVGCEDRFRGSQTAIRERLADYLPLFAGASPSRPTSRPMPGTSPSASRGCPALHSPPPPACRSRASRDGAGGGEPDVSRM